MSSNKVIKLKIENNQVKKIFIPPNFNSFMKKLEDTYPNQDENKAYQIIDTKGGKIIQDEKDYQEFITEHSVGTNLVLSIKLIDKNDFKKIDDDYQLESSNIFFNSVILPKREDTNEDNPLKAKIRSLVKDKLKKYEQNILNDILNNNQNKSGIIHKGIKCDQCGMKNIQGIRYKCSTCLNYNLCEKCESNSEHNHIFVKIREPNLSEEILNSKINSSNIKMFDGYTIEPKCFHFSKKNLVNLALINFTNNGNIILKKGFIFKCIKESSNLIGNDVFFESEVGIGETIKVELSFDQINNFSQNEFFSSYKLIDEKSNMIGKITKFKIIME